MSPRTSPATQRSALLVATVGAHATESKPPPSLALSSATDLAHLSEKVAAPATAGSAMKAASTATTVRALRGRIDLERVNGKRWVVLAAEFKDSAAKHAEIHAAPWVGRLPSETRQGAKGCAAASIRTYVHMCICGFGLRRRRVRRSRQPCWWRRRARRARPTGPG